MIYAGMFTQGEYPSCKGWGHSTWEKGVELAQSAHVQALAIIHLHPRHEDDCLRRIEGAMQHVMPSAFIALAASQTARRGSASVCGIPGPPRREPIICAAYNSALKKPGFSRPARVRS